MNIVQIGEMTNYDWIFCYIPLLWRVFVYADKPICSYKCNGGDAGFATTVIYVLLRCVPVSPSWHSLLAPLHGKQANTHGQHTHPMQPMPTGGCVFYLRGIYSYREVNINMLFYRLRIL